MKDWLKVCALVLLLLTTLVCSDARSTQAPELKWDREDGPGLLKAVGAGQGIHLLWWNVHNAMTNSTADATFAENISSLIQSESAPDVLAFGEFRVENLGGAGSDEMLRRYPSHFEESYPGSPGYGLAVYSRYPFKILSVDTLDFTPRTGQDSASLAAYRLDWCGTSGMCLRPLVILELNVNGTKLTLVVVHLFDAWRKYRHDNGVLSTAWQVMLGTDNPLWFQSQRFREVLAARLGRHLVDGKVVVMGDFNMPKEVLGTSTEGYEALSRGLVDALPDNAPTFPASSSEEGAKYPAMQIDHVFVAPQVKVGSGCVLPLRGSDHYPIYIEVAK